MGVVRTDKWLKVYLSKYTQQNKVHDQIEWQRKALVDPLCQVFRTNDAKGLHLHLWQMGLCRPDQPVQQLYNEWLLTKPWHIINEQYSRLKKKWNGPEVKIYLLPMNNENELLVSSLGGKTGFTVANVIILFIGEVSNDDLRALFTHEYNHACRLQNTGETEETITFLESMIMEGLAEFAVREEVGETYCASWTTRYDHKADYNWYDRWIKPYLFVRGRSQYLHLLYGDKKLGIPQWLGYYTGYQLVKTAVNDIDSTCDLLDRSAETLLSQSAFSKE